MRSAGITAEQWATARIFGWIEWCNLCDPVGSRPNNGPQQGYLGGLSGAIYAIRRDHGRTMGHLGDYLGGLSGAVYTIRSDHGRTMGHSKDIWVD